MDEIVRTLLLDANALGVWLLGAVDVQSLEQRSEILAAAVADESLEPPTGVFATGETYLDVGDTRLYALPVEGGTLVVKCDRRSSFMLVRLRARIAKTDMARLLAERNR